MRSKWIQIFFLFVLSPFALSQNSVDRYKQLGHFYKTQSRVFEAEAAYRDLLKEDSVFTDAYIQLAEIYDVLDEPDSVVHYYTMAFKSDIRVFDNGFKGLGDLYLKYGFNDLAADAYSKHIGLLKYQKEPYRELRSCRDSLMSLPNTVVKKGDYSSDVVFLDTLSQLNKEQKELIVKILERCSGDQIELKSYHSKDIGAFDALRLTKSRGKHIRDFIQSIRPNTKVLLFNYGRGKELFPNTCERSRAFNRRVKIECR